MEREQAGPVPDPAPVPGWRGVRFDRPAGTVLLDPGVRLDLGAVAKAWAADRAAATVARRCGCGVLVSLGGDVAVAGDPPVTGFAVGVSDRCDDAVSQTVVALRSGGLATSGIGRRTWRRGGRPVHHIVDPATGLPVDSPWCTATVAAGSCVAANTASTAAMVEGERAVDRLRVLGTPGRLVRHDGAVVTVGDWPGEPA
jgi:thiamine biosynthesis lipoprotein